MGRYTNREEEEDQYDAQGELVFWFLPYAYKLAKWFVKLEFVIMAAISLGFKKLWAFIKRGGK